MRSKNHRALTAAEREHLERVKSLPCSVCDAPPPSSAHHIRQDSPHHWTAVALCWTCHQSDAFGWHGRKTLWRLKKLDELDALAVTIQRLMEHKT